jgi:uncharacterized protein (DUF2236 family)
VTVTKDDLERSLDKVRALVRDPSHGLFGPGSRVWHYNREGVLFLGGGRAALLQTAHPYVAHGVDQHSATKTDPFGRFARTFDNVFAMVFGDLDHAITSARRVHAIHQRIRGAIPEGTGAFREGHRYEANQEDALLWVHATLWETSVLVYELIRGPIPRAEKEAYYQETKRFAYLFGIPDQKLPPDWESFLRYNQEMWESPILSVGKPALELRKFLMRAPSRALRPAEHVLSAVTAGLLPERLRHDYRFEYGALERATFEATLRALRLGYGALPKSVRFSPAYQAAMDRLGRHRQHTFARVMNQVLASRAKRPPRRPDPSERQAA